jgi:transposase
MIELGFKDAKSHGGDSMGYWAEAPIPRDQILLISTTLGDRIPDDHPVRLFDEILASLDFSAWENHYCRVAGQPAIPPRIVAGAILYGLSHGIRSSRRLEWACGNAVDFMWMVEGRPIDHSTFCHFRTRFDRELKDLFKQMGRLAISMGLVRLNQVALDGTRVRANSSRHATATAQTLESRLAALDEQIAEMFAQATKADAQEGDLFGDSFSLNTLPRELSDLKRRQEALAKALNAAQKIDAQRTKQADKKKRPAKVPVADAESSILPNKEGGYAPNHTPLAAVDGQCGWIVDAEVITDSSEPEAVLPTVERIEATFGEMPDQMLADSAFGTGSNLNGLEVLGVEPFMPAEGTQIHVDNPARRADLAQAVPEVDWPKLPRRPQTHKLDRSAFIYDSQNDSYFCPMGHKLEWEQHKTKARLSGEDSVYEVYRCKTCVGCPLASDCLSGLAQSRTVSRDQHEDSREAATARLKAEEGRKIYARRAWMAETPYAFIKTVMGLRQFLLRGLDKVRTEWRWACTAYNLHKLVKIVAALRARLATGYG